MPLDNFSSLKNELNEVLLLVSSTMLEPTKNDKRFKNRAKDGSGCDICDGILFGKDKFGLMPESVIWMTQDVPSTTSTSIVRMIGSADMIFGSTVVLKDVVRPV
jgi:hypothetical protein